MENKTQIVILDIETDASQEELIGYFWQDLGRMDIDCGEDGAASTKGTIKQVRVLTVDQTKSNMGNLDECRAAMQEFVDRVERGEISSTKTYNKFKEILGA